MDTITRDVAVKYRDWWMERMLPDSEGKVRVKPNTANRHIGNMRLYLPHILSIMVKRIVKIHSEICILLPSIDRLLSHFLIRGVKVKYCDLECLTFSDWS